MLVVQNYRAAQYTGDEASAQSVRDVIAETVVGSVWTVASFDADSATIHEVNGIYGYESDWDIHLGSWFVASIFGIIDCLDDADFQLKWRQA